MDAARCKSWPTGSGGKAPKTDGPKKPMAGRASHPAGHCCHWSLHLEGQTGRHSHSLPRRSGFSARTPEANLTQTQHSALAHPAARPIHTQKPNISAKRALCLRPHLWGDGQPCDQPARRTGDLQGGLAGRDRLAPAPAEPRPASPSFGGEPEAGFAGGRRRTETALRPARHSHTATRYLGNHAPTLHSTHSYVHQSWQPERPFKIFVVFSETWRNTPIAKAALKATIAKVAKRRA